MKLNTGHWKGIFLLSIILLVLTAAYLSLTPNILNDGACDKVWNFRRCGSSLYYGDTRITDGDADSFQVLNFNFAKDKNHLYYGFVTKTGDLFDAEYNYKIRKIKLAGMDIDSLKTSSEYFLQDKNHVYRATLLTDEPLEKISYLEAESFEILDHFELALDGYTPHYSKTSGLIYKDKNHVFMRDYKIYVRDPASFILIDPNIGIDKYQEYPLFKMMPAELRNRIPYGVVGNEVYYNGQKIKYADGNSFEVFPEYFLNADNDRHYARDNNNVFYDEHLIRDADPDSFELLSTLHLTLAQAEAGYVVSLSGGGFTHINTQYARDKNNVYYQGKKISADSESFRVMELGYGYDAFDQRNKYLNGENIGNSDNYHANYDDSDQTMTDADQTESLKTEESLLLDSADAIDMHLDKLAKERLQLPPEHPGWEGRTVEKYWYKGKTVKLVVTIPDDAGQMNGDMSFYLVDGQLVHVVGPFNFYVYKDGAIDYIISTTSGKSIDFSNVNKIDRAKDHKEMVKRFSTGSE